MVVKIIVPDLGATGGDVLLAQWLVSEGDFVESGTPLFVVETDKATDEVQAFRSGYIRKILSPDGVEVELGSIVALMTDTLEEAFENETDLSNGAPNSEPKESRNGRTNRTVGQPPSKGSPSKVRASPRARKLAEERSINLSDVPASATDGVISAADVERFAASAPESSGGSRSQRVALSPRRRAIAEVTALSKSQIPHFYLFVDFDLTEVECARSIIRERGESPPTVTELVVFATAQTLAEGTPLNSRFIDGQLEVFDEVDVGLMIGLESGVVAPTIKRADRMSVEGLRKEIYELRRRAEAGELSTADMQGGGMSISNLGMHGVDYFAGVIQPGQSSLLSIGQIGKQPKYINDQLEPRSIVTACLSVDHRVTDGVGAANFLARFKHRLESWSGKD